MGALLVSSLPYSTASAADLEAAIRAVDPKVVTWRRDFHQNPELSNREVRTSKIVAEHLKKLGLEVETGIARTGVVALLRTGKPGPTIALRADMDALPVTERTDVPFKSLAKSSYRGEEVGVMHACGHDSHTAVLMGVAEVLVKIEGASCAATCCSSSSQPRKVRLPAKWAARRKCSRPASSRSTSPKWLSVCMSGPA